MNSCVEWSCTVRGKINVCRRQWFHCSQGNPMPFQKNFYTLPGRAGRQRSGAAYLMVRWHKGGTPTDRTCPKRGVFSPNATIHWLSVVWKGSPQSKHTDACVFVYPRTNPFHLKMFGPHGLWDGEGVVSLRTPLCLRPGRGLGDECIVV